MKIETIRHLFTFIILCLAQVLVFNHVTLLGCATQAASGLGEPVLLNDSAKLAMMTRSVFSDAVEAFAGTVSDEAAGKIIVFSAVRDKEYGEMVRILCEKVDAELYVATHIDDPRGTSAEQLGRIFRKYTDRPVVVKPSAAEALLYALSERKGRKVYCLGSLYLTGMIKKLIQEVKQMLDYEEEISKFKPSLEVEGIEEAVYQEDLTDVTDLLKQVIDQKK